MDENWEFLLSEFRRHGGIADNICQKEGEYGRGIFPVNPNLKSKIFTPSKLMIKKDDIYLEDNKLRIKNAKPYSQEIINFFNFYQDNFSWGSGGKETTESFEKGISLFNLNLKKMIKTYALVDLEERHKGEWDNVIKQQFLNSRAVNFKNIAVIAPVWELVNHKVRALPFILDQKGISTPNYPAINSEIRFSYSNISPLNRFFSYGFFSQETIVFSIPFSVSFKDLGIFISCKGMTLHNDSMEIRRSGNKIILEGMPIGDVNHPNLPYEYFRQILKKIGYINISQDLLIKIFQLNIECRKKIIYESQLIDNQVSRELIKLMNYELSLISSHN
tara:strand:+ start:384 stop:1379 length:996 start_codon:yes stop_codon:yes gene_type:complete